MKNKSGIVGGFVLGMTGFLLMFKLIVLDHVPPTDELAPGIVVVASLFSGLLFAFVGYLIQNHSQQKANTTEPE